MDGVHIGTAIEQQGDNLAGAAADSTMERRAPGPVAAMHERGIGVEQRAHSFRSPASAEAWMG